ncbi:MAG: type II toxin-antitoxin system RelE/ParE family toxin [bacterium]|nr:type II toxin-antitoxin system RelE/ParE family toxin [bacterium]
MKRIRVFKTKTFTRWLKKSELTDEVLIRAVDEMRSGLIDADLGGNVLKKRVAVSGRGKRGGARTIVATNKDDRWFFIYGFEKNVIENMGKDEENALKKIASKLLSFSDEDLLKAIVVHEMEEVAYGDEA